MVCDYIATWIGKSNKIAQKDYFREMNRPGEIFFWDDTKKGHATINKYFCFIDAIKGVDEAIVKIFKIIEISKNPEDRLEEWSKYGYNTSQNYSTSTRNLLTIEKKCLKEIKWSEYSADVNYKRVLQCTQSLRYSILLEI